MSKFLIILISSLKILFVKTKVLAVKCFKKFHNGSSIAFKYIKIYTVKFYNFIKKASLVLWKYTKIYCKKIYAKTKKCLFAFWYGIKQVFKTILRAIKSIARKIYNGFFELASILFIAHIAYKEKRAEKRLAKKPVIFPANKEEDTSDTEVSAIDIVESKQSEDEIKSEEIIDIASIEDTDEPSVDLNTDKAEELPAKKEFTSTKKPKKIGRTTNYKLVVPSWILCVVASVAALVIGQDIILQCDLGTSWLSLTASRQTGVYLSLVGLFATAVVFGETVSAILRYIKNKSIARNSIFSQTGISMMLICITSYCIALKEELPDVIVENSQIITNKNLSILLYVIAAICFCIGALKTMITVNNFFDD